MYPNQMMAFVVTVAVVVALLFAAASGAPIFFNVDVGQTTFVDYRHNYGQPERWYWGECGGRPCKVYLYPSPFPYSYRHVYVIDGVVWQVTY